MAGVWEVLGMCFVCLEFSSFLGILLFFGDVLGGFLECVWEGFVRVLGGLWMVGKGSGRNPWEFV